MVDQAKGLRQMMKDVKFIERTAEEIREEARGVVVEVKEMMKKDQSLGLKKLAIKKDPSEAKKLLKLLKKECKDLTKSFNKFIKEAQKEKF